MSHTAAQDSVAVAVMVAVDDLVTHWMKLRVSVVRTVSVEVESLVTVLVLPAQVVFTVFVFVEVRFGHSVGVVVAVHHCVVVDLHVVFDVATVEVTVVFDQAVSVMVVVLAVLVTGMNVVLVT